MTFVLSDSTKVNSYGFRCLMEGGDFSRFKSNPVMLLQHDQERVIGRWSNLRVEGGVRLLADAVFDEGDPLGVETKRKVEEGFLNGCSIGLRVFEMTHSANGTEDTATRWELVEASIVAVPADAGATAVRLYDNNYNSLGGDDAVKHLQYLLKTPSSMTEPRQDAQELSSLQARVEELEAQNRELQEQRVDAMLDAALSEGTMLETEREPLRELALLLPESVRKLLDARKEAQKKEAPKKRTSLAAQVAQPNAEPANNDRAGWNFLRWAMEDPEGLKQMRDERPEEYSRLIGD